jgi:hypothetical protein
VPFVAGAAALYWGQTAHAAKPANDIANQIRGSVRKVPGMPNSAKGVLDLSFFSPTLSTPSTTTTPTVPAPIPLDLKPTPIGEPQTWTGRLEATFAAGGESSGLILQMVNRRVELGAPTALLNQLKIRVGQLITIRGQLESIRSVERGLRQQVRVIEILK